MTTGDPAAAIAHLARQLNLDIVGFTPVLPPVRADLYLRWLADGRAATMSYLARSAERRADPRQVMPAARTVISLAESYFTGLLPEDARRDPSRGIIAAYAWGRDYHDVLREKLEKIAAFVRDLAPNTQAKCFVDSGPVLEKGIAEQAALGFIGKNTLLISPRIGSMLFLGEIFTTLDLPATSRRPMPTCGTCTRCLEACPTRALLSPYVLDASRCISYLTIEHKGVIPRELRPLIGNHVFGCDDCQNCCPWNERFSSLTHETVYRGGRERQAPPLVELAGMTEPEFRVRFAGSAVLRPGYMAFLRNVAVALGNWRSEGALEPLAGLVRCDSPVVRLHAAWALGRTPGIKARLLLEGVAAQDADTSVRVEAEWALQHNQT